MAKKKQKKQKQTAKTKAKPAAKAWPSDFLFNRKLHLIILFFLGFLLYANTIGHDYAQDDSLALKDNKYTQEGFAGIPDILRKDMFSGFFDGDKSKLVAGGRYRPLSMVTFAIEVGIFGNNPHISHFINCVAYGILGMVLYMVLMQWFNPHKKPDPKAFFISFAASLLFVAHPIHTEVVANIKGRDEIMALGFALAAIYYVFKAHYASSKDNIKYLGLAMLMFFLSLMSKENAVTFFAIIPLSCYFFMKEFTLTKGVKYMAPIAISTLVFILIRSSILGGGLGESSMELMNNPFLKYDGSNYIPFTFEERYATIFYTMLIYIKLLFVPHPLVHDYYPTQIPTMYWSDIPVILSLLIYLGLGIFAVVKTFKKDPIAFGILFFLLAFSIQSNIAIIIGTNMSERFMFMASVGFCLILAVLLYRLMLLLKKQKDLLKNFKDFNIAWALVGLVVLLFSIKTITRNPVWKNDYTLFTSDVKLSPNSAKLRNAAAGEILGTVILPENADKKDALIDEAIAHLDVALANHPGYSNAWLLYGNAHYYKGEHETALAAYDKADFWRPGHQDVVNNRAVVLRDLGKEYGEKRGDLQKGIRYLKESIKLNNQDADTYRYLGISYGNLGQTQEAINNFQKSLDLRPDDAYLWYNLGLAYRNVGNEAKWQECYQKAKAIDPDVDKQK